jgi:hypothetical protein
MSGGDYFYEGAKYGFDPEYGGFSQAYQYNPAAGIGIATDPRTANQLKEASNKLNTGATTLEVSSVSPNVFEAIPKEHFTELNRLRKLVGKNVELTLHAPFVEPSGLTKRGWNPAERVQAETQMWDAVEKAHLLNPDGHIVTTFHSSIIGLPAETQVWEEKEIEGEKKKVSVIKEVVVINESTGEFQQMPTKASPFESEEKANVEDKIKRINKDNWFKELQHLNYAAEHGANVVDNAMGSAQAMGKTPGDEELLKVYKNFVEGKVEKVESEIKKVVEKYPHMEGLGSKLKGDMQQMLYGDLYLRDAYNGLRNMFDQAYESTKKSSESGNAAAAESLKKMDDFRNEIKPKLNYLDKPEKVHELALAVTKGVQLLRSIETPQTLMPLKQFSMDKGSETFSNLALKSYKAYGDKAPIISIENAPPGMGMTYSGKDLNELIQKSQDKFVQKAVSGGMSESEAREASKKVIGATWDIGHINMIRKFGAGKEELLEETRAVAKNIKHVHLSDNFGMEHTELPMGMGNVPTKEMMKIVAKENDKFKKIIEAGDWYQHFQTIPFGETLSHFDSPIYAMKNASYWGPQGYSAGLGTISPEVHHSMYGAGFANLPVELGGQMSGRSRVSGNPID